MTKVDSIVRTEKINYMKEKTKFSCAVTERFTGGYRPNTSVAEMQEIAKKLAECKDQICFTNGVRPKNVDEVITRYINKREDVSYVRKTGNVKRKFYASRSRIDAYRLVVYYFGKADIQQVFARVDALCKFFHYCETARRYMCGR